MSSSKQDIHELLNAIPSSSEDIYHWFTGQRVIFSERRLWGFPVPDSKYPLMTSCFTHSKFLGSRDPNVQICRCGKSVSLLKEDWYVDDAGCSYHWGKRTSSYGSDYGPYNCCKRISKKDGCMHHKYHVCSFKFSEDNCFVQVDKKRYGKLNSSNIFALDTEMVYTTSGLEVARVSLVSIRGNIIIDKFVQPKNLILDYNTPFSGISAANLDDVKTTLADVQALLLKVLNQDSILIGHGLENDLIAIRLIHGNVVDTSLSYRHEKGFPYRHSLKTLSLKYLNKTIHAAMCGHNSVEDARICIALMLKRLYLQSRHPYFNYSFSKIYSSRPSLQQIFNFYAQTPPPNYMKHIPVINGQAILIPKLCHVSQIVPVPVSPPVIYAPLSPYMFR